MGKNKKKLAKLATSDAQESTAEAVLGVKLASETEDLQENTHDSPSEDKSNGHDNSAAMTELQQKLSQMEVCLNQKDEELTSLKTQNGSSKDTQELEARLAESEKERDDAKEQLEGFLSKISSMKTVFRNYKATQEELEEVKEEMALVTVQRDEAIAANTKLNETVTQVKAEWEDLNGECDRLSQQLTTLRREFQNKDDSLQDEKYTLENEVNRLTKKINEHRANYNELELAREEISMENKNLLSVIEELNGKLEAKESEVSQYKAVVEDVSSKWEARSTQMEQDLKSKTSEIAGLRVQLEQAKAERESSSQQAQDLSSQIEKLRDENAKITQLQDEMHTKQLVIGKLRHEAIILNEHLTKSLSMLKQQLSSTDNTIDKELISNVILSFLQIPRGDTKKFEALLLISALLEWDDARKVQAGLSHNTGKSKDDEGRLQRLNFVSLWTDFLEKESSKATK